MGSAHAVRGIPDGCRIKRAWALGRLSALAKTLGRPWNGCGGRADASGTMVRGAFAEWVAVNPTQPVQDARRALQNPVSFRPATNLRAGRKGGSSELGRRRRGRRRHPTERPPTSALLQRLWGDRHRQGLLLIQAWSRSGGWHALDVGGRDGPLGGLYSVSLGRRAMVPSGLRRLPNQLDGRVHRPMGSAGRCVTSSCGPSTGRTRSLEL